MGDEYKDNIWLAIFKSCTLSGRSRRIKIRSNLDINAGGRFMFSITDLFTSYFDFIGFAATSKDVLAFNWQTIPAFATDIVCCYIAYSRAIWELTPILSN